MNELVLAQSTSSSGGTSRVLALYNDDGKITKFIAESDGNAWCGFSSDNSVYELSYKFNERVEIRVNDDYYVTEGQVPDNLLSVKFD